MDEMPKVDLSKIADEITAEDMALCRRILVNGRLRATKPAVDRGDAESQTAAYLWRMVAFFISPKPKHQCYPAAAEFDLPGTYGWGASEEEIARARAVRKAAQERADRLENLIVTKCVVSTQWHGVKRWGQAFGLVGTPQLSPDGAIIYR